jgi:hypothetical protein
VFKKLESLCGDVAQHNVTSLLAECVGGCVPVHVSVTRDCRYSGIAGSYVAPKTVSMAEPPKSKSAKPQEWKAVVGKLPAGSDPVKAAKAAPVPSTSAPSKNVKGGSNTTTAARKPLVSRN